MSADGPASGAALGDVAAPMEARPSLLAAVEVFGRVAGTLAAVFAPVVVFGAAARPGPWSWVGWTGLGLAADLVPGLVAAAIPAVRLAFTRYHLDDEGVRVRTAFLGRSERRVPWGKVTLVRHRRTLLDRLFGLSRVEIVAYGDRGAVLHLTGLRDARPVRQRAAMQMRRSASVAGLFRND